MNTKTKAILASTLLTALFAGQSAMAGQDKDNGIFATNSSHNSASVMMDKVSYSSAQVNDETASTSGRK